LLLSIQQDSKKDINIPLYFIFRVNNEFSMAFTNEGGEFAARAWLYPGLFILL
jgi:hypothetical protein